MSNQIPQHIAVVCDGNRRWAREHGWEVIKGHEYAFDKVFTPLARKASDMGIKYLTFWVFSTENWNRDKREVDALMNIFRTMFEKKSKELDKENVRIKIIGDLSKFAQDIQDKVNYWIDKTKDNDGITVIFAMNYGGRDEILRAAQKFAAQMQNAECRMQDIDEEKIESLLDTAGIPDPELIVRTSGQQRLSGFLLWQSEYAELYFPEWSFPEFTPEKLEECVEEFQKRKRRFGA